MYMQSASSPSRILLAEDNDADALIVEEALRQHAIDFELVRATDGEQAIALVSMSTISNEASEAGEPSAMRALLVMAAARLLLQALTNSQYGFHRDELATLDDARHLAWGYVA